MHDESQIVDLAAVARVRAELADVATRYPGLLTRAAQDRTAAWLEGDTTMAKTLDPDTTGEMKQIAVRLPADALAVLDAEATRLNALAPGLGLTRSDALRSILAACRPPGSKPKSTDPKARYEAALQAGHAGNAIATAIGYGGGRAAGTALSRWRKGAALSSAKLTALTAWFDANGF